MIVYEPDIALDTEFHIFVIIENIKNCQYQKLIMKLQIICFLKKKDFYCNFEPLFCFLNCVCITEKITFENTTELLFYPINLIILCIKYVLYMVTKWELFRYELCIVK